MPLAFCKAFEKLGITILKAIMLSSLSKMNLMYSGLIKLMYFFLLKLVEARLATLSGPRSLSFEGLVSSRVVSTVEASSILFVTEQT